MYAILAASSLLRIILGFYNSAANDNHLVVSHLISEYLASGIMPEKIWSCWECYHPKLYHGILALIFYVFDIHQDRIIIGQQLNVAAGITTLLIARKIISVLPLSSPWKLLVFALFCFNPSLILINIQATNDSFVIAFGSICTYYLLVYSANHNIRDLVLSALFLLFSLLTKGSGLAIFAWFIVSITLIAALNLRLEKPALAKQQMLLLAAIATVIISVLILIPSPYSTYKAYLKRWINTSNFAAVNFEAAPAPSVFERSYHRRPGVISIYDSYFRLNVIDLIKHPYISNGSRIWPWHRTSLWSQLYGRLHFSYFAQWVITGKDPATMLLGSIIMVAAVFPTLVFLLGIAAVLKNFLQIFRHNSRISPFLRFQILSLIEVGSFIALIILFTLSHRDFSSMKDIYLMPAILAFLVLFSLGINFLQRKSKSIATFLFINCSLLLCLYCFNDFVMVKDLIGF